MLTDGLQFLEGSVNTNFVFPYVTQAQRDTIAEPTLGEAVFQTDVDPGLYIYDGSEWIKSVNAGKLVYGGDVTNVNGSTTLHLVGTGVAAGTYNKVVVDTKGRVTSATNETTVAGLGLVDAVSTALVPSGGDASSSQLVLGSDSRLTDTRNPKVHIHSAADISNFNSAVQSHIDLLKGNVPDIGSTLKKLYDLIISGSTEIVVATISQRNALNIPNLHTNVFVQDAGDGKWALYKAISLGVNATYIKLSDPNAISDAIGVAPEMTANKGVSGGYAGLDLNSLLLVNNLPSFTGDVTSVASSNNLTLTNTGVAEGTYNNVTVDAKGRVTHATNASYGTNASNLTSGTLNAARLPSITGDATISGTGELTLSSIPDLAIGTYNNVTIDAKGRVINGESISYGTDAGDLIAGTLNTARLPAFVGDVSSTVGTNTLNLTYTGVTAGTYNNVTVDVKGRVTGASNVSYGTNADDLTSGTLNVSRLPAFTGGDVASAPGSGILTLGTTGVATGTYNSVTVDIKGRVTAAANIAYGTNASNLVSGTLNVTRLPDLSGDVISTAGTGILTLSNSGVTAGTYNNVTVDAKGRVTDASNVVYTTTNADLLTSGKLAVARLPALTGGDVTSDAGSGVLNLTDSGVSVGTYNTVTVDAKGRVTAATNTSYATTNAGLLTSGTLAVGRLPVFTGGDVTTSASGTVNLTLTSTGVVAGTYNNVTVDVKGRVTDASNVVYTTTDASLLTSGTLTVGRLPELSGGDVVSLAGTGILNLTNSGVTAGTYNNVTVDAKGRVTAASNVVYATTNASLLTSGTLVVDRLPAFTGDVTSTTGSGTLTLSNSGVVAGTYNSDSSLTTPFTVDAKGRITSMGVAQKIASSIVKKEARSASTLIPKGTPVYVSGADDINLIVLPASYSSEIKSSKTLGLALTDINLMSGEVITDGEITGLDTSTAVVGDPVWLGDEVLIYGSANKPVTPNHLVYLGVVVKSHAQQGTIFVKVQNGYELGELHNVLLTGLADKQGLVYNNASGLWVNQNIATPDAGSLTSGTLAVARLPALTGGDVTSSAGSGTLSLTTTGIAAGTYKSVNVDTKGRVTAGTNPTTLSGYGITDAVSSSLLGANSGVATLGVDGKVPPTQLPSYVDDVLEYANLAGMPVTGETSKIYVALDTNKIYRWSGSTYIEISPVAGNADTATKLATARSIEMTGDVAWSIASFDGSANVTSPGSLSTTGVVAGTYNSDGGSIAPFTVDSKGRITSVGVANAITTTVTKELVRTSGSLITKGSPVYISGANGANPLVSVASYSSEIKSSKTLGLALTDIDANTGEVITDGKITGIDTSSASVGDPVWLGNGTLLYGSANKPSAPNHLVYLGVVVRSHAQQGTIFVKVQNGYELDELHDVKITSPVNNNVLRYDSVTSLWVNDVLPLPTASATVLGGVKVDGTTITISNGVISGSSSYTLPTASNLVLGGVKVDGTTITISNGVISASGGGGGSTNASDLTSGTLAVARLPALTGGDVTSTAGSGVLTLGTSGVSAGTYTSVTVNTKGLITGGTNPTTLSGYGITDAAGLASPTFTGVPAAPTATADTNTTQLATTAYVVGQAASVAPVMDGTAAVGTSLKYARQDHVHGSDTSKAGLSSANTFTGTQTFNGTSSTLAAVLTNAAETTTISATAATGTINIDFSTQSVLYYTTNASANWIVNFRHSSGTTLNAAMAIGQTVTMSFLVTQGTTAYYNTSVQVDGTTTGVTTKWQGGSAPTAGDASSIDCYTYAIIKTAASTFTVLAALSKFA